MESVIPSISHINHRRSPSLKYFNSYSKFKPFVHKSRKNKQRLIPLTREITKAMMDLNVSHSSSNVSEKPILNTLSITSLVKGEVQNILEELSISDQFIRKEEIYDLIEKCLKGKVKIINESDESKTTPLDESEFDLNQEFEVTAEEIMDDKDKLIVENMQILEHRIMHLEERLSCMLQNIPKLRRIQAKRFKINTNALIDQIRKAMHKVETEITAKTQQKKQIEDNKNLISNYDDIYYARREYTLNLLNYKKSLETLELNQKPKFNPYVKPIGIELPKTGNHSKRKPMFLACNYV